MAGQPHGRREETAREPQEARLTRKGRAELKPAHIPADVVSVSVAWPARARVPGRRRILLLAVVLVGLLATVVVTPHSGLGQGTYLAVSIGGAAAAWLGVRRRALRRGSIPWVSLTLTLNAAGDLIWQVIHWSTGSAPDVSIADICYLASYCTLAGALVGGKLGGRRRPDAQLHAVLDGTAALAVALLVVYQSSIAAQLADHGHGLLTRLVWIAYPVLDALLIGLVAWRVVLHGQVRRAALLGLTGIACWLAADLGVLVLAGTGSADGWLGAGWLGGVILLAGVPWTRSTPHQASALRRPGHGPWRMALNVAPFAVPTVLELVGWARGHAVNPVPDVLTWALLLLLSTVRTRVLTVDAERAWAAVRRQARRSEALAVNTSDAVAVVGADDRLTDESMSLARLLGAPAPEGAALTVLLEAWGISPAAVQAVLGEARESAAPVELELDGRTTEGRPRWLGGRAVDLSDDPDVAGVVVSIYDITRRKLAERELAHQAFHDGLTGLANRSLFLDRAEQALRRAGRSGTAPIVLSLDLDGFKDVNDSLGHLAGDTLLEEVAGRLLGVVRGADTVARLGGDEFAVLVDDPAGGMAEATALADRLLAVLAQPVHLGSHRVGVAASIGIVTAEPESTPLSLLQDADIAMYRAKAAGRGQWVAFDPAMRTAALERIELERELGGALAGGQLRMVYQPVVDLRDDRIVGFEALLRWQHPGLGAVGPDRFVPVAEASGLIVPIGRWVLAEASRAAARWQRARGDATPLSMAVNVSPRQLAGDTFLDDVTAALEDSGIPPSSLTLEITETALVVDPDAVAERLAALRRLGVRIALDDFGTGYSSLSYLRQFPVDVLKIDRSFVSLLSGGGEDAAIVHGLVQLGRRLDLDVVAEGVETPEQRDQLRAERCDLAQGYLFSRPLEAADAERALAASAPLPAR